MLVIEGCLELKPDEATWFSEDPESPVTLAPLIAETSTTSCQLPEFRGDPADRIIMAMAIVLGIPPITADEKIITWNAKHGLVQVIGL